MAHSLQLLIDDTSPALSYYPFSDSLGFPDLAAGWNPYFTDSGFAVTLGEVGNGSSFHVTSCNGAAFSVQWFGSGIQLFGNVTGAATYDLTLDGQTNSSISSFSSDATLLASYEDLQPANHTLSLVVHNPNNLTSSRIAIDSAVISVTTASQNPNATLSESVVEDTDLAFKGEWSFAQDPTFTSGDTTFHTSTNVGDRMVFAFNGTAVAVNGFRDAQSGQYAVTLDNQTRILDGRSSFKEHATLFFATGLDPTMPHQIAVINNENRLLSIGSVNVTSVANPFQPMAASSSGLPKGTIAAAVVAAVLGFLVLCLFLLFAWRRRHRVMVLRRRRMLSPSQKATDVGGVIDIRPDTGDDRQEDKGKGYVYHTKEGSVSFTLDLPIQTRSSPREASDNGIQVLPRSPTVSLSRPYNNSSKSTRERAGTLLLDVPTDSDAPYLDVEEQSPFHVSFHMRSREGSQFSRSAGTPPTQEALQLTPIIPQPPRVNVVVSSPTLAIPPSGGNGNGNGSDARYSFLDISSPTTTASIANHSSSSSSRRRHRRSVDSAGGQRLSLPSAFNYQSSASSPALMSPSPHAMQSPRSAMSFGQASTIRPLPRIPHSPPIAESHSLPSQPASPTTPPALHLQTRMHDAPSQAQSSMSPPSTSTAAHGNIFLQTPHQPVFSASPTESIPVTVSDIHFRHSSEQETDAEALPPHPPLPARQYASPFIMQKLLGSQPVLQSPGSTPAPGPSVRPDTGSGAGSRSGSRPGTGGSRPGTGESRSGTGESRSGTGSRSQREEGDEGGPRFALPPSSSGRPFWR